MVILKSLEMTELALSLKNIHKSFKQGKNRLTILNDANLDIKKGELVALVGPSGSGKTTLLQIAGLLDSPDKGQVLINGHNCSKKDDDLHTKTRRSEVGFIYQFHHLLPEFTALENVVIPQLIAGAKLKEAEKNGKEILKYLGLGNRLKHKPSELSGGEQQRVATARAIVNKPSILLGDEPTGNLDPETAENVAKLLIDSSKAIGLAVFIVTHNLELAHKMDRIVTIQNGEIVKFKK